MIPTPDLTHLRAEDYEHIYEPAEDTFILLDALEQDAEKLASMNPLISLEIGSGSGCVSSFLGKIVNPNAVLFLCTDINPYACKYSALTGRQNKVELDLVHTSFAHQLLARLQKSVDIIMFNPPYVPTVPDEASGAQANTDIEGSWAGGQNGMQITDKCLPQVAVCSNLNLKPFPSLLSNRQTLLSAHGRFYLVAVPQNNISDIRRRMKDDYSLNSEIVLQRRAGRERLSVIRFMKDA
ncbi:S-adenosyl-L-methionine-dependent methyltransferase [Mycena rebaudengoi]|nr:S-adenosyl-L-methionine-dependent methyltransferase [Mycena rebaudengoi]